MANNSNIKFLWKKYEVKKAYVFAIINENFKGRRFERRIGADVDFQNVKKLIKKFGFEDNVKQDLTQEKMEEEFNKLEEPKFNNNDAFICFISTHGEGEYFKDSRGIDKKRDGVYGTDGEIVYLDDLVDILAHNKSLKGKPIIIIAQHCRGREFTHKNSSGEVIEQSIRTTPISIPSHRNVLIAYSTVFNAQTYRNTVTGSWFIHYFTEALLQHDENISLIDILSEVHNLVARRSFTNKDDIKQMPCFSHSLTMSVFFKKPIIGTEISLSKPVPTRETQQSDKDSNSDATKNRGVPTSETKQYDKNSNSDATENRGVPTSETKQYDKNSNSDATENQGVPTSETKQFDKDSNSDATENRGAPTSETKQFDKDSNSDATENRGVPTSETEQSNKDSNSDATKNRGVPTGETKQSDKDSNSDATENRGVPTGETKQYDKDSNSDATENRGVPTSETQHSDKYSNSDATENRGVPTSETEQSDKYSNSDATENRGVPTGETQQHDKYSNSDATENRGVPTGETQQHDKDSNSDATENQGVPTSETQHSDKALNSSATENEENKDVSKTEMEGNKDVPKTERLIEKAFVFIIINEIFNTKKRQGAQVDLRNILQVCETFGFEKHVEENLSRDEMEQKVLEKIKNDNFDEYDALIVFISSYGEHNDVIGVCGQKISIDDFVKSMARNPTLNNSRKNKPKLIFSENSNYIKVETDLGSDVPLPMHADVPLPMYADVPLPMHADVLVAHSNLLTGKTYHDSVFGSWFMHWLTTFLKDFGDKMSLTDILTMVNDFVANVDAKGTSQVPCFSSSLRMALRFQRAVLSERAYCIIV
ncbi:serine-aspartate repeat-containing protein F-like isoform X2 [Xenia sp. Carnegie-2017]|uniref:serine-aspartate repeat-containing protein F-like isoform X2 n=1 Tax=Xenia sp. Carnegie-2017 TaxID=2897299 RepID=UPI001F0376EA|nr:serine-aspartate repeat-containing protein F-like isoform X2 [Xenia sp. Carnegie-2017]